MARAAGTGWGQRLVPYCAGRALVLAASDAAGWGAVVRGVVLDGVVVQGGAAGIIVDATPVTAPRPTGNRIERDRVVGERHASLVAAALAGGVVVDPPAEAGATVPGASRVPTQRAIGDAQPAEVEDPSAVAGATVTAAGRVPAQRAVGVA